MKLNPQEKPLLPLSRATSDKPLNVKKISDPTKPTLS